MEKNENPEVVPVPEAAVKETETPVVEDAIVPVKKKKTGLIVGGIIGLLVLIVGGIGAFVFLNNPKTLMTTTVNKLFKDMDKLLEDLPTTKLEYDLKKDTVAVNANIQVKTDMASFKNYSGAKLKLNAAVDYNNKELTFDASVGDDNKNIADVKAFFKNDNAYASLGKLFEGILDLGPIDLEELFSYEEIEAAIPDFGVEDIRYMLTTAKDAFNSTLDIGVFETENDTIDFDGKELKVKKVIYTLKEDEFNDTMKAIADYLIADAKFVETLDKMLGNNDKGATKDLIRELKDAEIKDRITITLYTTGIFNSVIGFEITEEDITLQAIEKNGKTEILLDDGDQKFEVFVEQNKDTYDFTLKVEGDKYLSGTYTEHSDKKASLELVLPDLDLKINVEIDNYKIESKKAAMSFDVKITYDGEYVQVIGDYNMEVGKKLEMPSFDGAKDVSSLTEEEMGTILDNFTKAAEGTIFEDLITMLLEYYNTPIETGEATVKVCNYNNYVNGYCSHTDYLEYIEGSGI